LVIIAVVIGLTNLWAQNGMKAHDVAILVAVLMGYDFTATTLLPVMGDMMHRLVTLPLAPQVVPAIVDFVHTAVRSRTKSTK
jgi:hypothetical protein